MSDGPRPDYRIPPGCHNCRFICCLEDYDDGRSYFCTHLAPPRPTSGDMHEPFLTRDHYDEALTEAMIMAWDEWSKGRDVHPYAICSAWRAKQ